MKSIEVLLLLILVMPVLCSNEKREKSSKSYSRDDKSVVMEKKSNKASSTYVLPGTPLHLSGYLVDSYIIITDESINAVKRDTYNYYLWTFSYKSTKNADNTLGLSEITINEDKSKFLFNSESGFGSCEGIEYDKEYSYKEIKDKCGEDSTVKHIVTYIQNTSKIWCEEYNERGVVGVECTIDDKLHSAIYESQSLEEIKYKLSNIKRETYSPSTEFEGTSISGSIKLVGNSIMKVGYNSGSNSFGYSYQNVTVTAKEEYTEVEYKSYQDYKRSFYYVCLASDCQYICEIRNSNYNVWRLYDEPCYKKEIKFDSGFNNHYSKAYNDVKNYDPNSNNLRRSLLEEEKNKKGGLTVSTKGYYYENIDNGYTGYFLIDNELTIIKQTNNGGQEYVEQLKLVLTLDDITKSVKIEDIEDSNIDQEKSGVEARYDEKYSDEICKSFIPLKDVNNPKYEPCDIYMGYLSQDYLNKEYNISESESSEMILKIHDIENEYVPDKIITLSEYDSTKLKEIVDKITKFTQPIPNDKCLKENITEDNYIFTKSLYNQVFYENSYEVDYETEKIEFTFGYIKYKDYYSSFGFNRQYINIDDKHYLSSDDSFIHEYVDYKGSEYIACDEKIKNDALKEFQDRINEIKKDIGIDDGSVEYMINIFLITLLLIIFL